MPATMLPPDFGKAPIGSFADRLNNLTQEEIAEAMERLPTDVLEWAVKFEGLSHSGKAK